MANGDSSISMIAVTGFGLEAVVARELKQLGVAETRSEDGRVFFQGDARTLAKTNLWLRSADRVQIVIGRFPARDFGTLFDQTNELPWENWLPRDAEFPVRGKSVKSQLHSVPDCQRIVKKSIVERLKRVYGQDWFDESGPRFAIDVSLLRDEVTLTLDTTGDGLHKRGYRKLTSQAPLRETLAASLVQLSVWNPERPLIDPFCGSGTIPVEAALIGRNQAPGLNRKFAAEAWPCLPQSIWKQVREEARDSIGSPPEEMLIGTDSDAEVLSLARYHARQAGVADCIHFQQQEFSAVRSSKRFGCLITNPPWGERLGEQQQVEALYRSMPAVFDQLETWSFFVLTTHAEFERLINRKATRRRKLFNARLASTYYQFLGPKPASMR